MLPSGLGHLDEVHPSDKTAESSGPAPQASRPETASNRSPRFTVLLSEKMAEARGHAPQRRCRSIRFKRVPAPRPVSPPKVPPQRNSLREFLIENPRSGFSSGPLTRTCTSISSFAGSRPVSWTMKGKLEPLLRQAYGETPRHSFRVAKASACATSANAGASTGTCALLAALPRQSVAVYGLDAKWSKRKDSHLHSRIQSPLSC